MTQGGTETDLYTVLGVPPSASPDAIRAAYRLLAQRYHPDHNPNDSEAARRMQAINQAFGVLNSPEGRAAYDRQRAAAAAPKPPPEPRHGAGRGQRPYYRGKNWGMHTGADAPPEYIVRAEPSSFNLVVDAGYPSPARTIRIHNDAPFRVRMAAVCSPWLCTSTPVLEVESGGTLTLEVAASPEAAAQQRGWRDGGVSLVTDDPRVFCPDVRVTAIFMDRSQGASPNEQVDTARNNRGTAPSRATEPDLREIDAAEPSERRGGWRRLFGL